MNQIERSRSMGRFAGSRRSPAIVVAALALVAAAVGTATAGPSAQTSAKVTKKKVKKIADKQINELAPGLSVAHAANATNAENASVADTATSATSAANSSKFNGQGPASFLRYNSTIPSGVTIKGVFGTDESDHDTDVGNAPEPLPFSRAYVSFPLPAPADLTSDEINFASTPPSVAGDDDPTCTGEVDAPTAPAGKVCLYGDAYAATGVSGLPTGSGNLGQGAGSRLGFEVTVVSTTDTRAFVQGTWAYTAP
jgi:hypothetical protein